MKIGNPKLLIDFNDWLPFDGESKVNFWNKDSDLIVEVVYETKASAADRENENIQYVKRQIVFEWARYFFKVPFPGVSFFEVERRSQGPSASALNEFLYSDFARNVMDNYRELTGMDSSPARHFAIFFMAENVCYHVIADGFNLSEEMSVS